MKCWGLALLSCGQQGLETSGPQGLLVKGAVKAYSHEIGHCRHWQHVRRCGHPLTFQWVVTTLLRELGQAVRVPATPAQLQQPHDMLSPHFIRAAGGNVLTVQCLKF